MALVQSLTVAYAKAIYRDGTKKFSEIRPDYVEAVKEHAANYYTEVQIAEALDSGYITQEEFDQTMAYKKVTS